MALLWAAVIPFQETLSSFESSTGQYITKTSNTTMLAGEGAYALVFLGLPLVFSMICFCALRSANRRYRRWSFVATWTCIGLVWLDCLLGLPSFGLFILPAAVLLSVAASRAHGRADPGRSPVDPVTPSMVEQPG